VTNRVFKKDANRRYHGDSGVSVQQHSARRTRSPFSSRALASFWAEFAANCRLLPALILFDDVSVMTSTAEMVCATGHA
jgi:hypothetical protein